MQGVRLLAATVAIALLTPACGTQDPATAPPLARLVVRVDDDGPRGATPARELRLTCRAPTDSEACGAAAGVSPADLAPVPADRACAERFGGPQTASIRGQLRGSDVAARFTRTDACEVARWNQVRDLLDEVR